VKVSFAVENRTPDLAVYLAIEGNIAVLERKDARIAAQFKVVDSNHLFARQQVAQLLVVRIGVGGVLRPQHPTGIKKKKNGKHPR